MSYMRGKYYIYSDIRGGMQFYCPEGTLFLPDKVFDALVAMRWNEMTDEERASAEDNALELGGGNLGTDAIKRKRGLPTVVEQLHAAMPELETVRLTRQERDPLEESEDA